MKYRIRHTDFNSTKELTKKLNTNFNASIDEIIEITYLELRKLRDEAKLKPGQKYRLIDYTTTVSPYLIDVDVLNHQFDLILTAIDNIHFAPKAQACQCHKRGNYFQHTDLEKWEIWYDFDNNSEKYNWAVDEGPRFENSNMGYWRGNTYYGYYQYINDRNNNKRNCTLTQLTYLKPIEIAETDLYFIDSEHNNQYICNTDNIYTITYTINGIQYINTFYRWSYSQDSGRYTGYYSLMDEKNPIKYHCDLNVFSLYMTDDYIDLTQSNNYNIIIKPNIDFSLNNKWQSLSQFSYSRNKDYNLVRGEKNIYYPYSPLLLVNNVTTNITGNSPIFWAKCGDFRSGLHETALLYTMSRGHKSNFVGVFHCFNKIKAKGDWRYGKSKYPCIANAKAVIDPFYQHDKNTSNKEYILEYIGDASVENNKIDTNKHSFLSSKINYTYNNINYPYMYNLITYKEEIEFCDNKNPLYKQRKSRFMYYNHESCILLSKYAPNQLSHPTPNQIPLDNLRDFELYYYDLQTNDFRYNIIDGQKILNCIPSIDYFTKNDFISISKDNYSNDISIDKYYDRIVIQPTGVIYRMIDGNNNDCPYDFKNIIFKKDNLWLLNHKDIYNDLFKQTKYDKENLIYHMPLEKNHREINNKYLFYEGENIQYQNNFALFNTDNSYIKYDILNNLAVHQSIKQGTLNFIWGGPNSTKTNQTVIQIKGKDDYHNEDIIRFDIDPNGNIIVIDKSNHQTLTNIYIKPNQLYKLGFFLSNYAHSAGVLPNTGFYLNGHFIPTKNFNFDTYDYLTILLGQNLNQANQFNGKITDLKLYKAEDLDDNLNSNYIEITKRYYNITRKLTQLDNLWSLTFAYINPMNYDYNLNHLIQNIVEENIKNNKIYPYKSIAIISPRQHWIHPQILNPNILIHTNYINCCQNNIINSQSINNFFYGNLHNITVKSNIQNYVYIKNETLKQTYPIITKNKLGKNCIYYNEDYINVTNQELRDLKNNSQLLPGKKYKIIDYNLENRFNYITLPIHIDYNILTDETAHDSNYRFQEIYDILTVVKNEFLENTFALTTSSTTNPHYCIYNGKYIYQNNIFDCWNVHDGYQYDIHNRPQYKSVRMILTPVIINDPDAAKLYNIGDDVLNMDNYRFINNGFDIIMTALSENKLSTESKIEKHKYDHISNYEGIDLSLVENLQNEYTIFVENPAAGGQHYDTHKLFKKLEIYHNHNWHFQYDIILYTINKDQEPRPYYPNYDYAEPYVYVDDYVGPDNIVYNRWRKFEYIDDYPDPHLDTAYENHLNKHIYILTKRIITDPKKLYESYKTKNLNNIIYDLYTPHSKYNYSSYYDSSDLSKYKIWYDIDLDLNKYNWYNKTSEGIIYHMIDEYGNDCPYDFKNILFKRDTTWFNEHTDWCNDVLGSVPTTDMWFYTFSWLDDQNNLLDVSIVGNDGTLTNDESEISGVYNNKMKICTAYNSGQYPGGYFQQILNSNVFISTYNYDYGCFYGIYSNIFGNECSSNTFGDKCSSNTFEADCNYNIFGNDCNYNTFGNSCYSNTFEADCNYNTFGNNCPYNTFGNSCNYNIFGNDCNYNTFESFCFSNTFGNTCRSNTFGDSCYFNTFGNNCPYNTFGGSCTSNAFENDCANNTFGASNENNIFGNECSSNTFGDNFWHNILENHCMFLNLNNLNTPISGNPQLQYIKVTSGVSGTDSSNLLDLTDIPRGLDYQTIVAKKSNGKIVKYCEADLIADQN